MEKFSEGFFGVNDAQVVEGHVPEASVEEMEDGVFVATDVEIDAACTHPVLLCVVADEFVVVFVVTVAKVIPATSCPAGHGVGFAFEWFVIVKTINAPHFSGRHIDPVLGFGEQGLGVIGFDGFVVRKGGEFDGKLAFCDGVVVLPFVEDNGKGFAPVALS